MINLEFYNETSSEYTGEFFEELLEVINTDFKQIIPTQLDKRKNFTISFMLVKDDIIQKLNKDYRGEDKPTDVISLSYLNEIFPGNDILGEIFISLDTAKKQAKEMNHDLLIELRLLFVHGVLHILGYEHSTEEDFQVMMDLTNQILGIK